MSKLDPSIIERNAKQSNFEDLHLIVDDEHLLITITSLWNIALSQPNDPEFATPRVFKCLANLVEKCINDKAWLSKGKNIYIPYYATHIIGSYTMNKAQHAEFAVESGVISPLMELLGGKISWVEQRVAVRALGHLCSHKKSFQEIKYHENEIITQAMKIASNCLHKVYQEFLSLESDRRLEYQRFLMTKGLGGVEAENKKAEEWASQLQGWSLYLLNQFPIKKRSIKVMCNNEFLKSLSGMWGGFGNQNSFVGLGLIRSICHSKDGRKCVSNQKELILSLCILSRSSDKWQFSAIESLLLLLKDDSTRQKVFHLVVQYLVDLVELSTKSSKGGLTIGDMITQVLLQDYSKVKYGQMVFESEQSRKAIEEVWELKVERRKNDNMMSPKEFRQRKLMVKILKQEGNQKFWSGNVEEAVKKYQNALEFCPLKLIKERIVLYSNRSQCYLLLKEPKHAISDTTRALSLSGLKTPHIRSLWRRSQAYDMIEQGRESLMDCLNFIDGRLGSKKRGSNKIPNYAMQMMNKQMNATWIFNSAATVLVKTSNESIVQDFSEHDENMMSKTIGLVPDTEKGPRKKYENHWAKSILRIGKRSKNVLLRHTGVRKGNAIEADSKEDPFTNKENMYKKKR